MASSNQTIWSEELPWIEYAHNSLTSFATGRSPFEASLGFQPPLFPSVEDEHSVPSVRTHLRRCHRVWQATQAALLCTRDQNKRIAAGRQHLTRPWGKRYGFLHAFYLFGQNLRSSLPTLSVRLRSWLWSILFPSSSSYHAI